MTDRNFWRLMAAVAGLVLTLVPESFAKSKPKDDFPDYNRLEYAKPLPPPDQQEAAPPPGSIHMKVGDKKKVIEEVPPETLGLPIRARSDDSGSEPPISDLLDDYKITPPTVSTPTSTTGSTTTAAAPETTPSAEIK